MSGRSGRRERRVHRGVACAALLLAGAGVVSSGGAPVAHADPTPGCVVDVADIAGWWRGEDDLTAQVGPGLGGGVPFGDGFVRRGFEFDGGSAAGTVSIEPLASVTDGVTFEAWLKPVVNGLVQTIASRWDDVSGDDTSRSFSLTLGPTGELTWMTDEVSTLRPDQLMIAAPAIHGGDYHHIAATWNLTEFAVYIDGALAASKPSQGLPLNPAASTPFRLGATAATIGSPFSYTGGLDEPTVWRRALTPDEVGAIVAAGPRGKCIFVPTQRGKLVPPLASGNGWTGFSVGIDGATAVAGAPLQNAVTVFSGAAYVFTRTATGWGREQRLVASDAALSDQFGYSVAIDGDTIVVGSYGNNGGGLDSGAAYVFTRTAGVWTQQAKLLPADIAPQDGFGYSVAIDGETIVVGSPSDDDAGSGSGSAYVFVRSGATWIEQGKLVAADGAEGDAYGTSVAVHLDTAVAGAPGADGAGINSGAAYVATRSAGTWSQEAELTASVGAELDQFGRAVDVHEDSVIVGAPGADGVDVDTGSATVFVRSAGSWAEQATLTAADAAVGGQLGVSVAIELNTAVAGSSLDSGPAGTQTGSASVFDRVGTTWSQLVKLEADDATAGDRFGAAVAIGSSVVVGAYLDDDSGGNSGAGYVFTP